MGLSMDVDINDRARNIWNRDYRSGMIDDRTWDDVGGLMRFIYLGKAAAEIAGFTDRQEYDDARKRGH